MRDTLNEIIKNESSPEQVETLNYNDSYQDNDDFNGTLGALTENSSCPPLSPPMNQKGKIFQAALQLKNPNQAAVKEEDHEEEHD